MKLISPVHSLDISETYLAGLCFGKRVQECSEFYVGKRTNKTLNRVWDTLKLSEAKRIFTYRLKNYRYLIDDKLHCVKRFGTNHIERKN